MTRARLGWNWTYWQQLAPLIRQLAPTSPLYPALLAPGTGVGLRSNDATINVISRTTANGRIWILAENRSSHFHRAAISGLPRGTTTATLFPSGRTKDVTHRTIRAAFKPRMLRLACSLRNGRSQISWGRSKSKCGQSDENKSCVSALIISRVFSSAFGCVVSIGWVV